jgi:hypothetical protein
VKSYLRFGLSLIALSLCASPVPAAKQKGAINAGDKLQALANLHPDNQKNLLFTLNYQLQGVMIPVCSEIIVTKMGSKEMEFTYQGAPYTIVYEGFTKKVGVSFEQAVLTYFGPACDQAKMQKLGKDDQEGIRSGRPKVGMTRDGVLFAMGRPPVHVNPELNANQWRYWKNRFTTEVIEFDEHGKVNNIQ